MSLREWYHSARTSWAAGARIWIAATLLLFIAIFIAWRLLEPAPPQKITIAAGVPGGAYDTFARLYQKHFEENGFELEVRNTHGSVENYDLLLDDDSGVHVALVQGGTMPKEAGEKLEAVCSVYFEPLWVFYRDDRPITQLAQLKGRRLAIGPSGSGVRAFSPTTASPKMPLTSISPAMPPSPLSSPAKSTPSSSSSPPTPRPSPASCSPPASAS